MKGQGLFREQSGDPPGWPVGVWGREGDDSGKGLQPVVRAVSARVRSIWLLLL